MQQFTHARGVTGVYVIVHVKSGRSYIGSSADIAQRWFKHRGTLRRGIHSNPRLQVAWDEHGEDAFTFLIVERVRDLTTLRGREQVWLDAGETYEPDVGFNLSRRSDTVGFRFTPEQCARVSAGLKGKRKSAAHRAALAARPITDEHRERGRTVGLLGKGVPKKAAHRRKIGAAQRGSDNHASRLTEAAVVEIMWRLANGERGIDLAAEYAVRPLTICAIKAGRTWRHITIPR